MRVAACITSFGRLHDLMYQTYAMLDQSYDNKHVFVAAKGYTPDFFNGFILPKFQHFIDEGKLTMRLFPNSNQLTNFVDTVRDTDISGYDLFCKIDDDDFYDRDYLKLVVAGLDQYPPATSAAWVPPTCYWIRTRGDTFELQLTSIPCALGCSLCLSKKVMQRIIEAENDRDVLKNEMVVWKGRGGSIDIGASMEDAWFKFLMTVEGYMPMNAVFTKQGKIPVYIGDIHTRHSVWRGDFGTSEFSKRVKTCENVAAEWINTPDGIFYLFDGRALQEGGSKEGKFKKLANDTILIQLDGEPKANTYVKDQKTSFYNKHE